MYHVPTGTQQCLPSRPHHSPPAPVIFLRDSPGYYRHLSIRGATNEPIPVAVHRYVCVPVAIVVWRHRYVLRDSPAYRRHPPSDE
jgi:hypothetical protein